MQQVCQSSTEQWWRTVAPKLRRALGLAPPSLEEAEAEMADAACFPMSDEEIERIVDYATELPVDPTGNHEQIDPALRQSVDPVMP